MTSENPTAQHPVQTTEAFQAPVHDAATLLAGSTTAYIKHGDQTYTLRLTRSGKLILTK